MIHIDAVHAALVGDCLSTVPFMKFLCDKHGTDAVVTGGFSGFVKTGLGPSYPFTFSDTPPGKPEARYTPSVAALFGYSNQCHMVQCFFRAEKLPEPELPLAIDLLEEPSLLPPGVVISPYSRSNSANDNKFWPHERWVSVCRNLLDSGFCKTVYVLGSSDHDDPAPYVQAGIHPVFDKTLPQVLGLLRAAPAVLTIDNGISHLAHYGGINRHVLLYPGCLPECWVRNPRATLVRAPMPIQVEPKTMLVAAMNVIEGNT